MHSPFTSRKPKGNKPKGKYGKPKPRIPHHLKPLTLEELYKRYQDECMVCDRAWTAYEDSDFENALAKKSFKDAYGHKVNTYSAILATKRLTNA